MVEYIKQSKEVSNKSNTHKLNYSGSLNYKELLELSKIHLSKNDSVVKVIIKKIGDCKLKPHKRYFENLIEGIISQQLSLKAAEAIFNKFKKLFNDNKKFPSPEEIVSKSDKRLRSSGLSNAKVKYVKDLASNVLDGTIKIHNLNKLSDDEIVGELIQVKGVGVWTAHMFMIFCLGRLDVLPFGDLGFKRALMINYKLRKMPDEKKIIGISEKYSWEPYRSVAAWYHWQSLSLNNIVNRA
jgi:DNA-3-methyladenine glycosylase II